MPGKLQITTLGGLSIQHNDQPVTGFASRKVEALLVYLACAQRAHSREVLAELLWEERSQKRALGNLRVALASLRKGLGEYVNISRETVEINPQADIKVDFIDFETFLDKGQIEEAVSLYRGEFLEGFYVRGAAGFEDWASTERYKLHQTVVAALHQLVENLIESGRFEDGLVHVRHLLGLDPLDEAAHRKMMALLANTDQRSAALAQYEILRRTLKNDLSVEPDEESVELFRQIQAGKLVRPAPKYLQARDYEFLGRIGEGGFGEVYQAYQRSIDRHVAIKVILPELANDPEFIQRFESEAQMVAKLEHPNIVPLYDYWRDKDGAYLVMRLLRGGNLSLTLRKGAWSLEESTKLLDQIAAALDFAHRQGVVHRDIKPQNILFDEDGNAYLTDFGIAINLFQPLDITSADNIMGSLLFISPEQAQSKPVTAQSDLYSLGILMYVVLTGQHPFTDESPANVAIKQINEPLPPLRDLRPELPEALEGVFQRVAAKNPAERYDDALEFASAFREVISDLLYEEEALTVIPEDEIALRAPAFLSEEIEEQRLKPLFVAREKELARLEGFLDKTLIGDGCVVFVTGGPGRGKTALLNEFAHRSLQAHSGLLVVMGLCNAYFGIGDPYLPFREVLAMLSGDLEARWRAGAISTEHARLLWAGIPTVIQALIERGPHLFRTFLSVQDVLKRASLALSNRRDLQVSLQKRSKHLATAISGLEQSHLFEQYTNVLRMIGGKHPLLILLDDLQWADTSSISLLFHLGRRLGGTRIMIACAYRPEEVALGRDGVRHPLEKPLAEFKRQFGDVWVDLAREQKSESQRFVDGLLDSEPNRFDQDFRRSLFLHAGGHPLFTIELLRAMQERGDLLKDDQGMWIEGTSTDWASLPARVEAVLEERVARLDPESRQVLSTASVEGENFTAQIVARVQGISDRDMLRMLSGELEKRHRLVRERGGLTLGDQILSRYKFSHALYQQYLYNELGKGERLLLHREIARVLEELYTGRSEEVAEQLARHYAGDTEKERFYTRLAGDRATARFANVEALRYFNRGLELTPDEDFEGRFELLLRREAVYDLMGEREAQEEDLVELRRLVTALGDPSVDRSVAGSQAQVETRWAKFASQTDYQGAVKLAEDAVAKATAADRLDVAVEAYYIWSNTLSIQGEYEGAISKAEAGIAIAREIVDQRGESQLLNTLGLVALDLKDPSAAREYFERSLAISQEIHDPHLEAQPLNNLGNATGIEGDYQAAQDYYKQALKIAREVGDRRGEGLVLGNLAWIASILGDFETAQDYFEEQRRILVEIGERWLEAFALINLSGLALARAEPAEALAYAEQGLALSREIGSRPGEAYSKTFLGHAQVEIGNLEAAEQAYQAGLEIRVSLNQPNLATESQAGLAQVALARQDIPTAITYVETILAFLDSGGSLEGTEEPLRVYLTCYQVLSASGDPRAQTILEMAHEMLKARAASISDADMRRRFLDNIPHHREIVAAWEAFKGQN